MKLYMNRLSPNVRRVRLTAAVLDLELHEIELDFTKGEHKAPGYLALNPNGAVPTLVDGDFVLTESRAIMQYLASQKPAAFLVPREERARADTTRWQFWDASHFSPPLGTLTFETIIKPMFDMGAPDQAKVAEARASFGRFGAVLDRHLEGRQYIVGDGPTLADLTIASSLMYAEQTEAPVDDFPNLTRWFARICALDAWERTGPGSGGFRRPLTAP